MRYLIFILPFFISGCGIVENIAANCGGDLEMGCRALFGGSKDKEQDERLTEAEIKILALVQVNNSLLLNVSSLSGQLDIITSILPFLEEQPSIDTLTLLISSLNGEISDLQDEINQNSIQLVELESNHNIVAIIDPCGDSIGYDEVFLRTSTGKIIASFSQNSSGLNTRFSLITPGNYSTTDGSGCNFTVGSDLSVIPSVEF